MDGSIFAFINYKQAAQFGHVGWGFQLGSDSYCFGSSDHLWKHNLWDLPAWWRYMHVSAHGDIDWWVAQGSKSAMFNMMRAGPHIRYHAYKELLLGDSSPEQAFLTAKELKAGGWHVIKHNCVHQAFLIFSSYNKLNSLPSPFDDPFNLMPRNWFSRINSDALRLR